MCMKVKPFRILSPDDGGVRGIIPANILETLENITGKRIHELFHLYSFHMNFWFKKYFSNC